jgi:hypothetical protein
MKSSPDCANTLAGAAFYALEQWKFFRDAYDTETNSDCCDTDTAWIYNGRMYAYADMLQQITGKRDLASWEEIVGMMAKGKL